MTIAIDFVRDGMSGRTIIHNVTSDLVEVMKTNDGKELVGTLYAMLDAEVVQIVSLESAEVTL